MEKENPLSPGGEGQACPCCLPILGLNGQGGTSHGQGGTSRGQGGTSRGQGGTSRGQGGTSRGQG